MTTLDDKLLGEKTQNYCSSSSDEEEDTTSSGGGGDGNPSLAASSNNPGSKPSSNNPLSRSKIDINSTERWQGYSQNTGPKGVIRDWQLYKEHEAQVREQEQGRLVAEIKRTAITCKPYGEELAAQKAALGDTDQDIDTLLDDELLHEFVKKRMENLGKETRVAARSPGTLVDLRTGDEFLKAIEEADSRVPVVIHIYDGVNRDCKRMNECLETLARDYDWVQFCSASTACVGVSKLFRSKGVPALLVYKGGELVGNFVGVGEELGSGDFYHGDVENFLIENGVLVGGGGSVVRG